MQQAVAQTWPDEQGVAASHGVSALQGVRSGGGWKQTEPPDGVVPHAQGLGRKPPQAGNREPGAHVAGWLQARTQMLFSQR